MASVAHSKKPLILPYKCINTAGDRFPLLPQQAFGEQTPNSIHGHPTFFGQCSYFYQQGDAFANEKFQASLNEFMKVHHSLKWKAHPIFSAPSTASYLSIAEYTFYPGAFAGGNFGEVTGGWAQDGSVVTVKRSRVSINGRIHDVCNDTDPIVYLFCHYYSFSLQPKPKLEAHRSC